MHPALHVQRPGVRHSSPEVVVRTSFSASIGQQTVKVLLLLPPEEGTQQ